MFQQFSKTLRDGSQCECDLRFVLLIYRNIHASECRPISHSLPTLRNRKMRKKLLEEERGRLVCPSVRLSVRANDGSCPRRSEGRGGKEEMLPIEGVLGWVGRQAASLAACSLARDGSWRGEL